MYTQLGRMRYATVSEFKGRKMVHIREYYDADGEIRPGKKGQCDVLNFKSYHRCQVFSAQIHVLCDLLRYINLVVVVVVV